MNEKNQPGITIDKEGTWYYDGVPITNRTIYLFFNQHLEQDQNGGFLLRIEDETCPVDVEDAPFVVTDVSLIKESGTERENFVIRLNDETEEPLLMESLAVGKDNVMYCRVKGGTFRARFLRPSYYRLAEHVVLEAEDRFYVPLNGKKHYIKKFLPES